jgi:hypothetical protein
MPTSWPSALPNAIDLLAAIVILLYALHGYQQGWLFGVIEPAPTTSLA